MKDAFLTTARRHNTIVIERGVVFRERERRGYCITKVGRRREAEASFIVGSRSKERKRIPFKAINEKYISYNMREPSPNYEDQNQADRGHVVRIDYI